MGGRRMNSTAFEQRVASVRRFNRLYTLRIGVLDECLLESPFTLTQARVLYELAHRDAPIARKLEADLGLDAGYLSRVLRGFRRAGLIEQKRSSVDRRQIHLSLTPAGRTSFAELDARSRDSIGAMLGKLPERGQSRLVAAMQTVERLLTAEPGSRPGYRLRPHQPGDLGWVTSRHGAVYAEEYGWNEQFEALVAEIVAKFIKQFDATRERCWIAEIGGEPAGSVFAVRRSARVAQLRLLLVEPTARGLGIGHTLVDECTRFAREAGYEKITLWTQSVLVAARRIYETAGFRLVKQEAHYSFGHDLIGENWELSL
jgi:DNA-binding MarR family transcriptional regulator/GNAT superfamily N-acetyltransferase